MKSVLNNLFQTLSLNPPGTPFEVEFWDGTKEEYGSGNQSFRLVLKKKETIKRILGGGSLGFGEEFMKGNILIEGNLQDFIKMLYGGTYSNLRLSLGNKLKIFLNYLFSLGTRALAKGEDETLVSSPTISKSKKNVSYHYDLGDNFYSLWLDKTLTYSGAYFKKETDTLERAQLNKYEHISRKLQLREGETMIDIGCGWGGMMFYAAKNYGVKSEGYTLSENQYQYVLNKIQEENLADFIKVHLKDYREAEGEFDKFVSIGMFEHVGKKFHPIFFDVVKKLLKPEGIGLIQTIGSPKDKPSDPWITKYIFPGGFIPALWLVLNIMSQKRLVFFDIEDLRRHYAKTLDQWIENFEKNINEIKAIMIKEFNSRVATNGGEEPNSSSTSQEKVEEFIRMWRLYLNGSSASFKKGNNRLYQITFANGLSNHLPLTRGYIYDRQ